MNIQPAPRNYQATPELLSGKTVLVTGAGDGIGRVAALTYAAHGATVVLLGRTESKLEAVYDEIEVAGHPKPGLVTMDLSQVTDDQCVQLAQGLAEEFGHLDGLLHNASLLGERRPIESSSYAVWQEVMQVNVNAVCIDSTSATNATGRALVLNHLDLFRCRTDWQSVLGCLLCVEVCHRGLYAGSRFGAGEYLQHSGELHQSRRYQYRNAQDSIPRRKPNGQPGTRGHHGGLPLFDG